MNPSLGAWGCPVLRKPGLDDMTDPARPAVGLSVGATTLAAVTPDRSVTRRPVITLAGQPVTDIVDRVGDPVGILAADGSVHPAEALLAEALRALAFTATGGRPLPQAVAVAYPAHWRPVAVEALRRALRRLPAWSVAESLLVPDSAAALTALRGEPGLPAHGVVALCDFGGSGTSITLVDGASFAPIGVTVRHADFSGDLVDRALLAHVIGELSGSGSVGVPGTSAIGSLTRLRSECRAAKERLSSSTVTALRADLPGFHGDVRLTRAELDEAIRRSLADVVAAVRDTMSRAGICPADLVAVASVGGGAVIPSVTTMLSEQFRVPMLTTARPALSAAIGAALRASRGPADDGRTALAAAGVAVTEPAPVGVRALAWSQAAELPELVPVPRRRAARPKPAPPPSARPRLDFEAAPARPAEAAGVAWYRRPLPVVAAALAVIIAAGVGTVVALRSDISAAPAPAITTVPQAAPPLASEAPAPPSSAPDAPAPDAPAPEAPAPEAPAPVEDQVVQAPPALTDAPTLSSAQAPPPPPVVETTAAAPALPIPTIPPLPSIPPIPPIPAIPGLLQIFLPPPSG